MSASRHQQGFVRTLAQIVGAVIVLALAARFAWWVATEENYDQGAAILWAIGFGAAYFMTLDNVFVRRVAAGFWVFLLVSVVSLPLSWMAGSTVALLALLAAQLLFSFHAGRAISARLSSGATAAAGVEEGASPPRGDFVASFGRWVLLSFGALMLLLVGPLMVLLFVSVVVDLSPFETKSLVAAWGLFGIARFGYRSGAVRWWRIPACALIYLLITGGIVAADLLAGPFAEGTGVQAAYTVMPGALVAAFVEVFVFGSGQLNPDAERRTTDVS